MNKKYHITGIGNAIVDILCFVDDAYLEEHNLTKGSMALIDEDGVKILSELMTNLKYEKIRSGGSVANSIASLSKLGVKASLIGKVADDELGKNFSDDLKRINCNFRCQHKSKTHKGTARSYILITKDDGQRTMCTYLGCAAEIQDEVDAELIASSKILYLEGYLWDSPEAIMAMREAIMIASENETKVAFTLSDYFCVARHKADFLEMISDIDILFANENEIKALLEIDNIEHNDYKKIRHIADNNTHLTMAITRGEKGSLIIDGKRELHHIKTDIIANPVDTTGAGDAFAAGVLYGLLSGANIDRCAKIGNIMAGAIIQKIGARFEIEEIAALKAKF